MDRKKLIWTVLIVLAIYMVLQNSGKYGKEAVLPAGQYNVDAGCTLATNVDPIDSRYYYYVMGTWITTDANGDSVWEKYGYYGGFGTTFLGADDEWAVIIENVNVAGDDIIKWTALDGDPIDILIGLKREGVDSVQVYSSGSRQFLDTSAIENRANAIIPPCATGDPPEPPACWSYTEFVGYVNSFSWVSISELVDDLNTNWVAC